MALRDIAPEVLERLDPARAAVLVRVLDEMNVGGVTVGPTKLNPLPPNIRLNNDGSISFRTDRGYGPPVSIDGVFESINNVLQTTSRKQKLSWAHVDGGTGEPMIRFVRYGVEEDMETPCIGWRVVRGVDGAFGSGKEMTPSHHQRVHVLREIVPDPTDVKSEVYIFSHRYDYHVELTVYAQTAHEADKIRSWLEDTISNNLWYFKYSGVTQFLFSERLADTYKIANNKKFHCRPLKFFISVEKLSWYSLAMLQEICLDLNIIS